MTKIEAARVAQNAQKKNTEAKGAKKKYKYLSPVSNEGLILGSFDSLEEQQRFLTEKGFHSIEEMDEYIYQEIAKYRKMGMDKCDSTMCALDNLHRRGTRYNFRISLSKMGKKGGQQ